MTQILEAKRALDEASEQANAMVARKRAQLGLAMIRARESKAESQSTIAAQMGYKGPQQVRDYERAYVAWQREHPNESLEN